MVVDRVKARALDRNGTVAIAPHGVLHGLFAHLAGFALIDIRHAAHEGTLQVAESVAAHALDAQLVLDLVAEQVGQCTGAG